VARPLKQREQLDADNAANGPPSPPALGTAILTGRRLALRHGVQREVGDDFEKSANDFGKSPNDFGNARADGPGDMPARCEPFSLCNL
jgi:hypothetical protein